MNCIDSPSDAWNDIEDNLENRCETCGSNIIKLYRVQAPNKWNDVPEGSRMLKKANKLLKAFIQRPQ